MNQQTSATPEYPAEMGDFPPLPRGRRSFLSAGPRAGKTTLLSRWRQECPGPTVYLALTPEDTDPCFFRFRLLRDLPDTRERYERLSEDPPTSSWGALLGVAVAETRPSLCLLLDDFDRIDGTPFAQDLSGLIRHFPETGTLAVASRHRFPEDITRGSPVCLDADHPVWREMPEADDLRRLPDKLLGKALLLHLIGEGSPEGEGLELLRRNIAGTGPGGSMQLRPSWAAAAEALLESPLADTVWDSVAHGIWLFFVNHRRTRREQEIEAIWRRIPGAARRRSAPAIRLEAHFLAEAERIEEALECYRQALALGGNSPDAALDLEIGMAELSMRLGQVPAELMARLGVAADEAPPLQRARILNLVGKALGFADKLEEAEAALTRVLSLPAAGDRAILYEHFIALRRLHLVAFHRRNRLEAQGYAERMIAIASSARFEIDLLEAHLALLDCRLLDESSPVPSKAFADIPDSAFATPRQPVLRGFLCSLGERALKLKEPELALRIFSLLKTSAQAANSRSGVQMGLEGMMSAYADLNRFEDARIVYEDVANYPIKVMRPGALLAWATALARAGRFGDAESVLRSLGSEPLDGPVRLRLQLTELLVRNLQGDPGVCAAGRALLDSPEGSPLWESEAILLEELGIRSLPPVFRIHAFGDLSFFCDRQPIVHWPRRKSQSLLALLVLHPEGLDSGQLAARLFSDSDALEALHTTAYGLRQVLRSAGAAELLGTAGGRYRLKWSQVTFTDLHEFDAFFEKASSLEAQGSLDAAAMFYDLALLVADAPLFENFPDEFAAERAAHDRRVRHAQAFVHQHGAWARPADRDGRPGDAVPARHGS